MSEIIPLSPAGSGRQEDATMENDRHPPEGMDTLTPRQREILKLLAKGFYYKEIGAELGISHATVRSHLHTVYQKLEVRSRARAVVKFHEHPGRPEN